MRALNHSRSAPIELSLPCFKNKKKKNKDGKNKEQGGSLEKQPGWRWHWGTFEVPSNPNHPVALTPGGEDVGTPQSPCWPSMPFCRAAKCPQPHGQRKSSGEQSQPARTWAFRVFFKASGPHGRPGFPFRGSDTETASFLRSQAGWGKKNKKTTTKLGNFSKYTLQTSAKEASLENT